MARITDDEKAKALAMSRRKSGVTRAQLAERLGITVQRATIILERLATDGTVAYAALGAAAGRAARTLVYTYR